LGAAVKKVANSANPTLKANSPKFKRQMHRPIAIEGIPGGAAVRIAPCFKQSATGENITL